MEYTCVRCQKKFNSAEALEQHRKSAHPITETNLSSNKIKPSHVTIGILIICAILLVTYFVSGPSGKYDDFARCITLSGAKFYGAWWCPHCQEQKAMFEGSDKYLPYIECSPPNDRNSELPICSALGIKSYPTWIFSDGSRANQLSLEELSLKTSCPLP